MFDEKEQLEKLFNLYLDGQLPEAEKAKVREILASDENAAGLLMKICRLNKNLQSLATPLPVNWDKLAGILASQNSNQTRAQAFSGPRIAIDSLPEELENLVVDAESEDWTSSQQAELEQALKDHPGSERLVGQQKALGVLLQHGLPIPDVNFDLLGKHISDAVHENNISKTTQNIDVGDEVSERAIADYLAGDMPISEVDEWEAKTRSNPAMAELLRQHQSLDAILVHGDPMPEVKWDDLQTRIHAAAFEQLSQEDKSIKLTAWLKQATRVAAAACVVMAFAMTWRIVTTDSTNASNPIVKTTPVKEIVAVDDAQPVETGVAIVEVDVKASENATVGGIDIYAAGAVVSFPPNIQVAIQAPGEESVEKPKQPETDPGL